MGPDLSWLTRRPIAHRGLHDGNRAVFENSPSAFDAAIEGGHAIECDVQLSGDATPHVFHDAALGRLTGVEGRVREASDERLAGLRLGGTADGIPTVAAFLAAVAGRTPVVMEMKGESAAADAGYVAAIAEAIDGYAGPLALMSFDSWLVEGCLAAGIGRPVGLTAEGREATILDRHRALFDKGCAFVSYRVHDLPNPFTHYIRETLGCPVISWTVRTAAERATSALHADQMTFEGFRPQDPGACESGSRT